MIMAPLTKEPLSQLDSAIGEICLNTGMHISKGNETYQISLLFLAKIPARYYGYHSQTSHIISRRQTKCIHVFCAKFVKTNKVILMSATYAEYNYAVNIDIIPYSFCSSSDKSKCGKFTMLCSM